MLTQDNGGLDRSLCLDYRFNGSTGWSALAGQKGVVGSIPVVPDAGAFVAVVYAGGSVTLYVDGVTATGAAKMGGGRGTLRIGGNGPSAATSFVGLVDHVFVYGWITCAGLSVAELDNLRGVRLAKPAPAAGSGGYALRLRRELGSYVELANHAALSALSALTIMAWEQPATEQSAEFVVVDKSGGGGGGGGESPAVAAAWAVRGLVVR